MYNHSIVYSKTLFYLLRLLHYTLNRFENLVRRRASCVPGPGLLAERDPRSEGVVTEKLHLLSSRRMQMSSVTGALYRGLHS